jgi:hypothetical protein
VSVESNYVTPIVNLKVNPKVGIGFTTIAGILLAIAQYLGGIGAMLSSDLTAESISLFATATVTLYGVIKGRMDQATAAVHSNNTSYDLSGNPLTGVAGRDETHETPETNVLYLDGDAIAKAVVKSINTSALVAQMRTPVEPNREEGMETEGSVSG